MVESKKDALIFTTTFSQEIKSEICCWKSDSEWNSIYLYHSFYLSSFIGQVRMLQMKVFRATVTIDYFLESVFWTAELALTFMVSYCRFVH